MLVVASLPNSRKVTLAQMETRLHVDRFEEMLILGIDACGVLKVEFEAHVKRRTGEVVRRIDTALENQSLMVQGAAGQGPGQAQGKKDGGFVDGAR